jgi:DNA-binding transcriptional regulator YiaG
MKAKNLVADRKSILRHEEIRQTNELIESLIKGSLKPEEIKEIRFRLDLIQSKIEELDWVLQAK